MPARHIIAKELAELFSVFSHPDRVRIVEELRDGERDVNALQGALGVSHSRASQNLSVLRMQRVVAERREGRHVFYRLVQPEMALWILAGIQFLEADAANAQARQTAIDEVRQIWKTPE
ncbi:MAG: ArsR/SmtB family transcription factor [Bryobacteraceae bacterium]